MEDFWEEAGSVYRGWYLNENNGANYLNQLVIFIYTDVWSGSGTRNLQIELYT